MMDIPAYFEEVRCRAAGLWKQLEHDPVLAGPWHQLFKQVQSPRHVVSELLQNADDAGATMASVEICDGDFVFTHNGEDFIKEHFTSLCRFGYSNKRALHTIGFRGIGFKSTFSLGDEVRLKTPSLSVAFHRERFTEPVWQTRNGTPRFQTEIRVAIRDNHRLRELEKNLEDWKKSPASLLFFRSIRRLTVRGQEIRWDVKSPGPVADSHWMTLANDSDQQFLLIKSQNETFPDEALEEIRQERMVAVDGETSFPPCKIEIVLGLEGRLFVILPTGVKTALPFACNAPFIQDPARLKIKDPETSPTNRWLLERVGKLATKAMLEWLNRKDLDVKQRCKAYALLPDLDRDDHSIEGNCGRIVEEACEHSLLDELYLVTENGSIEKEKDCVDFPRALLDVWSAEQAAHLFNEDARPILSRYVESEHRRKLVNWNVVDKIDKENVLDTIVSKHLPKPDSWVQLLTLWSYVAEEVLGYHYNSNYKTVRIFPVQGKDVLFSASEVVRLGEKKLLHSQEDWQFLADYLLVLNQNWPRYLAEQRHKAEQNKNESLGRQVETAYKILDALDLSQASDVSQVIDQVADKFFEEDDCDIEDCIRLAQLAAKLGATVTENFQYVTRDGYRKPVGFSIVNDVHNDLGTFIDDAWYEEHVMHEDYRVLLSCTEDEWYQWAVSDRSKLLTFVPLEPIQHRVCRRDEIRKLLRKRGLMSDPHYRYVTNEFIFDDWDFDEAHWNYWKSLADEDAEFWGHLFTLVMDQPKGYWSKANSAKASQVATTGTKLAITHEDLLPSWIIKFRDLPCLQDTRGKYRQPAELLRRTPGTESLLDVEPFVRAELDTETTRQLLALLGVRDTPTGPDRLLDRLRALATVDDPPVYEVEKWCRRLDHISTRCSTEEIQEIREIFAHEKLILTTDSEWVCTSEVFLHADEDDAPGAAVVHSKIQDLALWHKVGIAERPTGDLALKWLAEIPANKKLSKDELRRVRALLPRYAERIWHECGHWLNLDGEWAPVEGLIYKLAMQTLIPWSNLFRPIKQKTADLQKLTAEMCGQYPFAELLTLADSIENRFEDKVVELNDTIAKPWLAALGAGLARVVLDDELDSQRVRELGRRLMHTRWQVVAALETTPYINGTPSGTPRRIDVLWKDTTLYVKSKSIAKMAKSVSQELGRVFGRGDIADSIKLCFEHDAAFVSEYLEENFKLLPPEEVTKEEASKPGQEDSNVAEETVVTASTDSETRDSERSTDEDIEVSQPSSDTDGSEATDDVSPADQGELGSDEEDFGSDAPTPPNRPKLPAKPKLIERYANARGFIKDNGEGRYYHEDGGWIERVSGASFPWERYLSSGELQQCYWANDHCIERDPLQLEADVWELSDKHPEKYTLLLADPDGAPVEYSGHRIRELRDSGRLTLFPANYRLVLDNDKGR